MEQDLHKYRTVSGLQEGEKITSEWTEAVPKNLGKKNEKSAIDQATEEITAKYKKQKKTGYFDKLEDVDSFQYVEPMLAKKYTEYKDKIDFSKCEYLLQPKLNGSRCVATRHGLFTRKGEKYLSVPHIEETLTKFFEMNPNAVLDGELYNYELRQKLNELMSLTRKTKNISEGDLKRSKEIVQYHIYDGFNIGGLDETKPYSHRLAYLQLIPNSLTVTDSCIKIIQWEKLRSQEQFEKLYNDLIKGGEEGAILRLANSPYERKRSKFLLKVKPEEDSEAKIVSLHFGLGNWSQGIKTATLDWNGKIFDATFKCTQEESIEIGKNQERWIGKTVTFNYFGLTGLGCPQYCMLDVHNCFKE